MNMLYKRIHCHLEECHQEHHPLNCLRCCCSQKCASREWIQANGLRYYSNEGLDVDGVKLLFVNKSHSIFLFGHMIFGRGYNRMPRSRLESAQHHKTFF